MEKIEVHSVIKFLYLKDYNARQFYNDMLAIYGSDITWYGTIVK